MKPQELLCVRTPRYDRSKIPNGARRRAPSHLDLHARPDPLSGGQHDPGRSSKPAADARRFDMQQILDLPIPNEAWLQALFELTVAESRLAQRLACGDSLQEAAQKLHIKKTTARTQLAAIFMKTDTRRQAQLVTILSRIAHLG